ncbi:DUF503 domain-containing protein [Alteribacillus iranensis]|uniref:YlxP-like protein n=1 Tax=Alteribacillus iranensis TaxID=930128 RepID=A0A1I2A2Q2_9BACI|nr:DUF503 family protein [Alteribacillus iranensis]SFE38232.1 hypothetical protein SAMN05192532_101624 [Alteribacillus iranensis]
MIGAVHCECLIYQTQSLKEKRAIVKSIITRLKQKLNVAAAEMDYQNLWQRTSVTIVSVNENRRLVEKELQKALDMIDRMPELERTITNYEWF